MRQTFRKVQHLGIEEGQTPLEKRSIMLLNEITFILLFLEALIYPEFLYPVNFAAIAVILLIQFFTIGPLVLSYFNRTIAAKWYFNIVFMLFMTALIATHGWELRADYCYLIFTVTAIIFFKKTSHRTFLIISIIVCYVFAIYYISNFPIFFEDHVTTWNSSIVFLAMIFSITLIVSRFVADNESYQKDLTKALDSLQGEQAKIEIQNKTLASVNKDLERFAYISSHNLKTPIRTIRSFTDLIERDLKRGKQENFEEYLDYIKQGTSQMQLLVTDILEYSQYNQQDTFETSEVDLNKIIHFTHSQLQTITEKEIKLQVPNLPIIQSNKTFITAIFQNLIENGVKYNESETVEITINYIDKEHIHCLSFKDNGIGIEPIYHDRIFKMFERLQNDSKYTGSGVGLGMSKKIIEKLNGRIWLESTLGQGSTFYVEFPKNVKC